MNTPVKTPKKGGGKRRRSNPNVFGLSPAAPNLIDDDDGANVDDDGNLTDEGSDVLFASATDREFDPSSFDDTNSNATDGTMTDLNASPEILEQVRSIDALIASQNDTLGSLMNTPSDRARSTPGDDDDYMRMELLRLDRYTDQLQHELSILAPHTPDRRRRRQSRSPAPPTTGPPLLTPPLARVPSADDDDKDNNQLEAGYGTYDHHNPDATLNLTASPIFPSGSNVNTPASSSGTAAAAPSRRRYSRGGGPQQSSSTAQPAMDQEDDNEPRIPPHWTSSTPMRTAELQQQPEGQPPSSTSSSSAAQQTTTSSSSGGMTSESSMTVMFVDKNSSASDSDTMNTTAAGAGLVGFGTPAATARGGEGAAAAAVGGAATTGAADSPPPSDSPASSAKFLAKGLLVPSPGGNRSKTGSRASPNSKKAEIKSQPPLVEATADVGEPDAASASASAGAAPATPRQDAAPPPPSEPAASAASAGSSPVRRNLFRDVLRTPLRKSKPPIGKPPSSAPAQSTTPQTRSNEPAATSSLSSFSPARIKSLVTGGMGGAGGGRGTAQGAASLPAPPLLDAMSQEVPTSAVTMDEPAPRTSPAPSSPAASPATTASSLSPEVLRTAAALGLLGDAADDERSSDSENDDSPTFVSPSPTKGEAPVQQQQSPMVQQRQAIQQQPDDTATSGANTSGDWIVSSPSTASTTSGGDPAHSSHPELLSTTLTTAATATTWESSLADPIEESTSPKGGTVVAADKSKAVQRALPAPTPSDAKLRHKHPKEAKGAVAGVVAMSAAANPNERMIIPGATQDTDANSILASKTAPKKKSDAAAAAVDDSACLDRRRKCEFTFGSLLLLFVLFVSLVILVVTSVVLTREQGSPVPPPGIVPSMSPSASPAPTPFLRRPTAAPSPAPTQPPASQSLFDFLVSISPDNGAALRNSSSPQYQAFSWLSGNQDLSSYSPMRLRQRYALATFYYSTNGADWDVSTNWMTNENECKWFSRALFATVCGRNSEFQRLELSYNNLDGTVPKELSLLSDTLQNMSLSGGPDRFLTGTIPTELGRLTNLWNLRLWNNRLTGPGFPTELGLLSNLKYLDVSLNDLTGPIGTEIGQLTTITWLDVSNNRMTGRIPTELGRNVDLMFLDLGSNRLSGNLPPTFGNLTQLLTLRLENNFLERINANLGMMSSLESLNAANNSLVGSIPDSIGRLANLQRLNLTMNQLNGTLPSSMEQLTTLSDSLDLSHNSLSGTIPSWLGVNYSLLRVLLLNSNSFSGTVPSGLAGLGRANLIRLDATSLVGAVPTEVCETVNETLAILFADCSEVACPCCTYCCAETSMCECVHEGTIDDWKCYY